MNYQNLAYCRYLFIWAFLYLIDIVPYTPLPGLIAVLGLEVGNRNIKGSDMTVSKQRGLIISEILVIALLLCKYKGLDLKVNIIFLAVYTIVLYILGTNVIELHKVKLPQDDRAHIDEDYWTYFRRVWGYMLPNSNI